MDQISGFDPALSRPWRSSPHPPRGALRDKRDERPRSGDERRLRRDERRTGRRPAGAPASTLVVVLLRRRLAVAMMVAAGMMAPTHVVRRTMVAVATHAVAVHAVPVHSVTVVGLRRIRDRLHLGCDRSGGAGERRRDGERKPNLHGCLLVRVPCGPEPKPFGGPPPPYAEGGFRGS